jgi:hypothetical protein
MTTRKAKFAAWVIMLMAAGLLFFIFRGNRVIFGILAGLLAVYGFISAGDDLIRFLSLPDSTVNRGKRARG